MIYNFKILFRIQIIPMIFLKVYIRLLCYPTDQCFVVCESVNEVRINMLHQYNTNNIIEY